MTLVASTLSAAASDAPVVTEADYVELPKGSIPEPKPERVRKRDGGGGGGAGIFNQDDLAGVLIVLALLLLIALYVVSTGRSAPVAQSERLVSTASAPAAAPAPAPLADPFGDKPVDLTPRSAPPPETPAVQAAPAPAPPPPAAQAVPAPTPACPPGQMMRVWFCTAQSGLTATSREALEKDLTAWGRCLTGKQLVVTGYADTRGATDYNAALSSARASAVAAHLNAKGVKVATTTGAGELPDLTDNQNCANQRRVDVRLSDDSAAAPSSSCAPPPDKFAAPSCSPPAPVSPPADAQ